METRVEVDRLLSVYRGYAAQGLGDSKWSNHNPGNQAIQRERTLKTRRAFARAGLFPLTEKRILDVGCGTGEQLGTLVTWGARPENLFGIDLLEERVRAARHRFPRITFQLANAEALPYASKSFNLVTVFTVFSSILNPQMAANVAREIDRVLAPGGSVLWYDFRIDNPFNRQVRGMSRNRVRRLFPPYSSALEAVSLLPPLARRLGPLTFPLYGLLNALPILRTHYLGLLTKP